MKLRTVRKLLFAIQVEMGEIPVRQPLPNAGADYIDPFLLLHHHRSEMPAQSNVKDFGVGPHPHRGFSPVTIVYQGDVHHKDSRGNNAVIGAGGVQWMNAGMGIVHSERPSLEFAKRGGESELIQLWINTPGQHKLDFPSYFPMHREQIPVIHSPDGKIRIRVIAGNYNGTQGFDKTFTEMMILDVHLDEGSEYNFRIPDTYHLCLYNMDARIWVENFGIVEANYMVWFNSDGEQVHIKAQGTTRILVMAGVPINEPVQAYGPFVMNNQTQIMQAIKDYQMGKMGVLIEDDPLEA